MNGYIQITIGDTPVGLKFAYPAIKLFTEAAVKDKEGENVYFIEGETPDQSMMTDYGFAKLLHCAYKNNCLLKEETATIPFSAFVEWVESRNNDEGAEEMSKVMSIYVESSVMKKMLEKKSPPLAATTAEPTLTPSSSESTGNLE